jgi:hypothetical protein
MTEHDFENFAALERDNRLESLREIRQIVCGIVLFNKDTGIGSTMDIPDREFVTCRVSNYLSSSAFRLQ